MRSFPFDSLKNVEKFPIVLRHLRKSKHAITCDSSVEKYCHWSYRVGELVRFSKRTHNFDLRFTYVQKTVFLRRLVKIE